MEGLLDERSVPGHARLGGHGLGPSRIMEPSLAIHTLEVRAYENDIPVLALVPRRAFFKDASHTPEGLSARVVRSHLLDNGIKGGLDKLNKGAHRKVRDPDRLGRLSRLISFEVEGPMNAHQSC